MTSLDAHLLFNQYETINTNELPINMVRKRKFWHVLIGTAFTVVAIIDLKNGCHKISSSSEINFNQDNHCHLIQSINMIQ
jgi:hypothetical protein